MKKFVFFLLAASLILGGCVESGTTEIKKAEHLKPIFYPPLPQRPRIQYLTGITSERDIGSAGKDSFRTYLLGDEGKIKSLKRPFSIAHEKGRIWVADGTLDRVIILDLAKGRFTELSDPAGIGTPREPTGVWITPDGYKFIADAARGQVLAYNERDEFVRAYGKDGEFRPIDVAVDGKRLYVADIRDNEIEVLDRDTGAVLKTFGAHDKFEAGGLYKPAHLDLASDGTLFVTDTLHFRIAEFDKQGNFVSGIGKIGDRPGEFSRPKGIGVGRAKRLYTTDAGNEVIQLFDGQTGQLLLFFAQKGEPRSASYLPADVHVDYDNIAYFQKYADPKFKIKYLIYVANQAGRKLLKVYAFGTWTGPTDK